MNKGLSTPGVFLVGGKNGGGGGWGLGGMAFTGTNRQGIGQARFAGVGVGFIVDGATDRFVEIGTAGFGRRGGRGDGNYCRGGSDGGGPAADVEDTAFGEENDRANQGEKNQKNRQGGQKRIGGRKILH